MGFGNRFGQFIDRLGCLPLVGGILIEFPRFILGCLGTLAFGVIGGGEWLFTGDINHATKLYGVCWRHAVYGFFAMWPGIGVATYLVVHGDCCKGDETDRSTFAKFRIGGSWNHDDGESERINVPV